MACWFKSIVGTDNQEEAYGLIRRIQEKYKCGYQGRSYISDDVSPTAKKVPEEITSLFMISEQCTVVAIKRSRDSPPVDHLLMLYPKDYESNPVVQELQKGIEEIRNRPSIEYLEKKLAELSKNDSGYHHDLMNRILALAGPEHAETPSIYMMRQIALKSQAYTIPREALLDDLFKEPNADAWMKAFEAKSL